LTFIVFFCAVQIVHSLPVPSTFSQAQLAQCSYLFYAAWEVRYTRLLVYSPLINFGAAVLGSCHRWLGARQIVEFWTR
jgi:hypothetical protein